MKLGQIVRYRAWREGDIPKPEVPLDAQGWDRTGIVIRICDFVFSLVVEEILGKV